MIDSSASKEPVSGTESTAGAACNCVDLINEHLKSKNAILATVSLMNFDLGTVREGIVIPCERRDRSIRKWTKSVIATYCPFCGIRCRPEEAPAEQNETAKTAERGRNIKPERQ